MKYIDAEKLKAHIQYLIKKDNYELFDVPELLSFISSLQQEQPEVDLEKAYKSYMKSRKDDISGNAVTLNMKDLARHFYELGLNTEQKLIPIPEERMGRYINYCLQREDDKCHCPTCGKFVTGLRLFPYYYDRENNDVYFASVCPECGKIIISKE